MSSGHPGDLASVLAIHGGVLEALLLKDCEIYALSKFRYFEV